MSYYVTHENSVLNINNAHLKVSGNVQTDVLKLGAMEFAPPESDVPGTVNFTNVTTGVTTTSNLNVGGTLQLGTVEVVATTHTLENTTALGNVTSNTIQFTNATTGLVATGNVEVGGELVVSGNVEVGATNLFVDTVNSRVGIGTTSPSTKLEIGHYGSAIGDLTALRMTNHATNLHGTVLNEYNLVVSDIDANTGLGNGHFSIAYRDDKTDNLSHRLRIAGNGNVGITLQHPRTRLQVGNLLTTAHSDRETIPQSNMGINADFPRTTSAWFANRTTDTQQDYWGLAVGTLYSGDSYLQNLNKNSTAYYNLLLQRHGGFVGIRNTDPYCPLHVSGYGGAITGASTHAGFLYSHTSLQRWNGNHTNVGIYADDDIMAGGYILATNGTFGASDRRIKKDIVDIDDGAALQTLRQLQPKQYKYIDTYRNTSDPVWGFIAQEVRETLPHSTQLRNECIPNITEVVTVSETNVLTFTNFDTSNLEIGTKIRVHDKNNAEHKVKVTNIIDTRSVRIDRDISEWTCSFNEDGTIGEGDSLYVYGQEVDDFVFIKKDAIWTVATAALQEVDRQLQTEKTKVATLETQLASVLARLDALENA